MFTKILHNKRAYQASNISAAQTTNALFIEKFESGRLNFIRLAGTSWRQHKKEHFQVKQERNESRRLCFIRRI